MRKYIRRMLYPTRFWEDTKKIKKTCTKSANMKKKYIITVFVKFVKERRMKMYKSCIYCGKIHERGYICPKKPKKKFNGKDRDRGEESSAFRRKNAWTKKAKEIKDRDGWHCAVCESGLYDIGERKYNYKDLEVHHIEKLRDDIEKGLDNDNLITLCRVHHRMADRGEIKKDALKKLVKEKEGQSKNILII